MRMYPCTSTSTPATQATLTQSVLSSRLSQTVFMRPILSALGCIRQVYGCPEYELASNLDHLVCHCPRWLSVLCQCFRRTREARIESLLSLLQNLKACYGPVVLGMACSSLMHGNRCFSSQSRLRVSLIRECQNAQGQLHSIFCSMRALASEARSLASRACNEGQSSSRVCSPAHQLIYSVCLGAGVYRVEGESARRCLLQRISTSCPAIGLDSQSEISSHSLYWDIFDGCSHDCHRLLFKVLCAVCNEQHFSC